MVATTGFFFLGHGPIGKYFFFRIKKLDLIETVHE